MIRVTIDQLSGAGVKGSHRDKLYVIDMQGAQTSKGERALLAFLIDGKNPKNFLGEYSLPYESDDKLHWVRQALDAIEQFGIGYFQSLDIQDEP
jgi:hypothetical protein